MSTLSVDTITKADGTGALSVPAESGTVVTTASPSLGRRRLTINGAMTVSQRGSSWTGLSDVGAYYLDRFHVDTHGGAYSISQSTDAPTGFANSLKIDCTTAETPLAGASDAVIVWYNFEGQDLQQLKKGTANAESVTLSFWVKSNKTGNFQVNLQDRDNSRLIGASVNISAADTWEYKTITYAGDTSGTLDNDNNVSLNIEMWFDAGSNFTGGAVPTAWETKANADRAAVNFGLTDSTANYVNITGVQLEVGSVATPFEHRSYGEELALCQRYYQKFSTNTNGSSGDGGVVTLSNWDASSAYTGVILPVQMRAAPSFSYGSVSNFGYLCAGTNHTPTNLVYSGGSSNRFEFYVSKSGLTAGQAGWLRIQGGNDAIILAAEL